jgi:hypothetical protein
MMDSFPQEHELLRLFGSQPQLSDRGDVPWFYNELTFQLAAGNDRLECTICPGYGQLRVRWIQGTSEQLSLLLDGAVKELQIDTADGAEALIATFKEGSRRKQLRIQVKPAIQVQQSDPDATQAPALPPRAWGDNCDTCIAADTHAGAAAARPKGLLA